MVGIQLNSQTKDLEIKDGGMSVGNTNEQNQYVILASHKGEIRQYPLLGVGIDTYTNDETAAVKLKYDVRDSFKQDGLRIDSLELKNGNLKIEAQYDRG